jgi:hypothetical protein
MIVSSFSCSGDAQFSAFETERSTGRAKVNQDSINNQIVSLISVD